MNMSFKMQNTFAIQNFYTQNPLDSNDSGSESDSSSQDSQSRIRQISMLDSPNTYSQFQTPTAAKIQPSQLKSVKYFSSEKKRPSNILQVKLLKHKFRFTLDVVGKQINSGEEAIIIRNVIVKNTYVSELFKQKTNGLSVFFIDKQLENKEDVFKGKSELRRRSRTAQKHSFQEDDEDIGVRKRTTSESENDLKQAMFTEQMLERSSFAQLMQEQQEQIQSSQYLRQQTRKSLNSMNLQQIVLTKCRTMEFSNTSSSDSDSDSNENEKNEKDPNSSTPQFNSQKSCRKLENRPSEQKKVRFKDEQEIILTKPLLRKTNSIYLNEKLWRRAKNFSQNQYSCIKKFISHNLEYLNKGIIKSQVLQNSVRGYAIVSTLFFFYLLVIFELAYLKYLYNV